MGAVQEIRLVGQPGHGGGAVGQADLAHRPGLGVDAVFGQIGRHPVDGGALAPVRLGRPVGAEPPRQCGRAEQRAAETGKAAIAPRRAPARLAGLEHQRLCPAPRCLKRGVEPRITRTDHGQIDPPVARQGRMGGQAARVGGPQAVGPWRCGGVLHRGAAYAGCGRRESCAGQNPLAPGSAGRLGWRHPKPTGRPP
jgi:hypothetical protein